MNISAMGRRQFLVGCSAAIAAMAGSHVSNVAFASPENVANQDVVLVIFLRGGYDALSMFYPLDDTNRNIYTDKRPDLQLPDSNAFELGSLLASPETTQNGLPIPAGTPVELAMHPSAAALQGIYQDNKMAVIHATGLNFDSRSHFDMMDYIERGTPGNKSTNSGWLSRHLASAPNLQEGIFPAMGTGTATPTSLMGSPDAVAMQSPDSFNLDIGHWRYRDDRRRMLRQLHGGDSWLHQAGLDALDAVDLIESKGGGNNDPANGAIYPDSSFGDNLQTVAQMIKWDIGLSAATIDLGGWDTHENQDNTSQSGYFNTKITELSQGLEAFYIDLNGVGANDYMSKVTVVVMSEFGRRLRENENRGTDHGHGGAMLVLGGNVNGGLYGQWPGLATDQLYDKADLRITTDYRTVLSEIVIGRLQNPNLGNVFPGLDESIYTNESRLGFIVPNGTLPTPNYDPPAVNPIPTPPPGTILLPNKVYLPTILR